MTIQNDQANQETGEIGVQRLVHTPGPWQQFAVDIAGDVDPMYRSVKGGRGLIRSGDGFELTGFITEADTRLIAAAPELLEACKRYLDAMDRYGHPDKTDRLMRAAIEKATGEVV